ncbi:MAG: hypothetical protein CVV64_07800 [Candidatus Wallbacteria bacterium HGW-Wallbacteria-1]|jgi:hypothetical protein|uniref:Galactose oxidase n=1 Tax=Candidatus Wallbacteria bacterium HGW-Wallbacteria-1 TaxID=2013854 RepID=A0A2N1PR76_9BACT|nr:MAG: hypothetical protein CVV64_07800 [Candidatus Wallbacteria bacterium HGW-Wallbacteria-1]
MRTDLKTDRIKSKPEFRFKYLLFLVLTAALMTGGCLPGSDTETIDPGWNQKVKNLNESTVTVGSSEEKRPATWKAALISGSWKALSYHPFRNGAAWVCTDGDNFLQIGGEAAGRPTKQCEAISISNDTRKSIQSMAIARTEAASGVTMKSIGDTTPQVIVCGGCDDAGNILNSTEILMENGKWTCGPPCPVAVKGAAAGGFGTMFVITGGLLANGSVSNETFIYYTDRGYWEKSTSMTFPRYQSGSLKAENKLIVFGGLERSGSGNSAMASQGIQQNSHYESESLVVESYDIQTGQWSRLPDLPASKVGGTGVMTNETVIVFGGTSSLVADSRVWYLEGNQSSWFPGSSSLPGGFPVIASILDGRITALPGVIQQLTGPKE